VWLDLDGDGPLHGQTYRALREAVLDGRLAPGARLPSSRALAREVRLARNTVIQAYEQLVAEGYALTRRGSGTYVATPLQEAPPSSSPPSDPGAEARPVSLSRYGERLRAVASPRGLGWEARRPRLPFDFRYGEPAYADLPYASWCRTLARCARNTTRGELYYGAPAGDPRLREALAAYLGRSRGVSCTPEQVLIVHGSQQAIDLAVRLLVDPGDRVVTEDPHYGGLEIALSAAGAERVPLPVDEDGLPTSRLPEDGARLVCVTPSHQFPTGAVMPASRRLALLAWAERHGAFVLEDDYDGEFRFDGRPLASLQGLDSHGRVLYLGTVSKVLFPSLRIGYVVAPPSLAEALAHAKAVTDTGGSGLEQRALAQFIASGAFERHLRRSRSRHASRRRAFLEAAQEHLGDRVRIGGANAGLHVVLWIPDAPAQRVAEIRQRASGVGVGVYSVHPFYRGRAPCAGLLMGFGALTETEIREGIRRLAGALH